MKIKEKWCPWIPVIGIILTGSLLNKPESYIKTGLLDGYVFFGSAIVQGISLALLLLILT